MRTQIWVLMFIFPYLPSCWCLTDFIKSQNITGFNCLRHGLLDLHKMRWCFITVISLKCDLLLKTRENRAVAWTNPKKFSMRLHCFYLMFHKCISSFKCITFENKTPIFITWQSSISFLSQCYISTGLPKWFIMTFQLISWYNSFQQEIDHDKYINYCQYVFHYS